MAPALKRGNGEKRTYFIPEAMSAVLAIDFSKMLSEVDFLAVTEGYGWNEGNKKGQTRVDFNGEAHLLYTYGEGSGFKVLSST